MAPHDAGTTNPTLLDRLGDWRDGDAWADFVARYGPTVRRVCRRYRLDAESTEDLCQTVWIELARRMRGFRYDPGKAFRGWLRRLCESRAIDLLRKKNVDAALLKYGQPVEPPAREPLADLDAEEDALAERPRWLQLAAEVQDAVRSRVSERTWRAFWAVAVLDHSVRDAAEAAGLSYYAAFAAQKRVRQMLQREGRRLLAARQGHGPEADGAED